MLNRAAIRGFLTVSASPYGLSNTAAPLTSRHFALDGYKVALALREPSLVRSITRFKIESETVTASLRQLRETLSPYCDVNGCVVPESAEESSGFGGIISPPWWDDFQEP